MIKSANVLMWAVSHLMDGGLYTFQYEDGTILWLKINFHNGELFCSGESQDASLNVLIYLDVSRVVSNYVFGCSDTFQRLTNVEWKHVEDFLKKRLRS